MAEHQISIADLAAPQLPDSGDFVYRLLQPGAALGTIPGVRVVTLTTLCRERDRILREADVLVIHMIGDDDLLPYVLDRRKRKKLTIFEVSDNFMDFQKTNPAFAFYEDPRNRARLMQLLSLCDAFQTTMPELERRFSRFNPRCAVFMNQMNDLGVPDRNEALGITVGWGGSSGHYEDIKAIAPYLIEWLAERTDVKLAIMADDMISSLFDAVPPEKKRLVSPGSLEKYYDFLQSLDIGIAPIGEEEFNLCRSDVKFMEYASRGVVPVCSNVPTYARTLRDGQTGFLFDTPAEMIKIIEDLANDAELRKSIGAAAFEYIRDERSEQACAAARLNFYETLISDLSLEKGNSLEWLDTSSQAARTAGSQHFLMRFGELEHLLYNGLILQFRNSDRKRAVSMFEKAVRIAPDSYLAQLYLANALHEGGRKTARAFDNALRLNPDSCTAATGYTMFKASTGDFESSKRILKKLQEQLPELPQGWSIYGEIEQQFGNENTALEYFEKALDANPYYAPAATMAGAIYLSANNFEKAVKKFSAALEVMPRSVPDNLGLGASLLALGGLDEAAEHLEKALRLDASRDDAARFYLDICKNDYKAGALGQAISRMRTLVEIRPADAEAAFWLARTYERAEDHVNAISMWKKVIEIDTAGRFTEIAKGKIS